MDFTQGAYKGKTLTVQIKGKHKALFDENFKQITEFKYDELYVHEEQIYVKLGEKEGKKSITGEVTWDTSKWSEKMAPKGHLMF